MTVYGSSLWTEDMAAVEEEKEKKKKKKELLEALMRRATPPWPFVSAAAGSTPPKQYDSVELEKMVEMRMRKPVKFDHVHAYKHQEEYVHFLIWVKGELVTLKDDWCLFPSDQLITQIRLLETQ